MKLPLCIWILLLAPGTHMERKGNFSLRTDMEVTLHQLLSDFTSEVDLEYNFLYVNCVGTVPCSKRTCESYTLPEVEKSLRIRGEHYVTSDIYPHSTQNSDVLKEAKIVNAAINSRDVYIINSNLNTSIKEITKTIRLYNKKCYIVIICTDEMQYELLNDLILSQDLFNIYLLRPSGINKAYTSGGKSSKVSGVYLMYEICAYCRNGKHELRFCNKWEYNKGFHRQITLSPSFKGNFYEATVKVGIKHPYILFTFTIEGGGGTNEWGGQNFWLIESVSQQLNFKLKMVNPADGTVCTESNSTYTGVCKLLIDGEVKMAGFATAITSWRFQHFDVSAIYNKLHNRIISAAPPVKPKSVSFLGNFKISVLIAILVSYIALTLALWIAKRFYHKNDKTPFMDACLTIFSVLCFEHSNFTANRFKFPEMIIVGVWSISCLFVISNLFGEMISTTVQEPEPEFQPIETFDQMAANGMSWITPPAYISFDYLPREKLPHLVYKSKKMLPKEALRYILRHPREYVYYSVEMAASLYIRGGFWNGKGRSPFHISAKTEDVPYMLTILLSKGSPYGNDVSKAILRLEAAGLYRHKFMPDSEKDYFAKTRKLGKSVVDKEELEYFTLEKASLSLITLALGMILSFLVFIIELLKFRINKRKTKALIPIINVEPVEGNASNESESNDCDTKCNNCNTESNESTTKCK